MVALAKSCQCVVCRPIVLSVTFYGVFEVTTIFIIISEYYLPFLVLTSAVMVQKQWWVNFWHLSTSRGWDAKLLAVTVFFTALDTHFKVFWMLKIESVQKAILLCTLKVLSLAGRNMNYFQPRESSGFFGTLLVHVSSPAWSFPKCVHVALVTQRVHWTSLYISELCATHSALVFSPACFVAPAAKLWPSSPPLGEISGCFLDSLFLRCSPQTASELSPGAIKRLDSVTCPLSGITVLCFLLSNVWEPLIPVWYFQCRCSL